MPAQLDLGKSDVSGTEGYSRPFPARQRETVAAGSMTGTFDLTSGYFRSGRDDQCMWAIFDLPASSTIK